jgi:hypothetical protein
MPAADWNMQDPQKKKYLFIYLFIYLHEDRLAGAAVVVGDAAAAALLQVWFSVVRFSYVV